MRGIDARVDTLDPRTDVKKPPAGGFRWTPRRALRHFSSSTSRDTICCALSSLEGWPWSFRVVTVAVSPGALIEMRYLPPADVLLAANHDVIFEKKPGSSRAVSFASV